VGLPAESVVLTWTGTTREVEREDVETEQRHSIRPGARGCGIEDSAGGVRRFRRCLSSYKPDFAAAISW